MKIAYSIANQSSPGTEILAGEARAAEELPPGTYIISGTVTSGGDYSHQFTETFTIEPPAQMRLKLDFANNQLEIDGIAKSLADVISISRATTGNAANTAGVFQSFASNVARVTDQGLLVEGSRTNAMRFSRDLTNAAWIKSNCSALKDQVGIDGVANSASSLTFTAANGTITQTSPLP